MTTELEECLVGVEAPPGDDESPLDLSSLQVIMLVEELETRFRVAIAATDIKRDHFESRRALRALLAAKGVA